MPDPATFVLGASVGAVVGFIFGALAVSMARTERKEPADG